MTNDTERSEHPAGTGEKLLNAAPLRITAALAERLNDVRSYSRLAAAIGTANGFPTEKRALEKARERSKKGWQGGACYVDRRKLRAIIENHRGLALSLRELRAIDRYLEPYGEGLAYNPLFEKPELLHNLAEFGRVEFLLGSKTDSSDPLRINISHMDFESLGHKQTGVLGLSRNVYFHNREVRMRETEDGARAELADPRLEALFGPHGPSIVCFASNRGNHVCEKMLCKFGVGPRPFVKTSVPAPRSLPFHFVWPSTASYVLESAFHMSAEEIRAEYPEAAEAVELRDAACLRYPEGCLVDELTDRDKREGRTLALCAAQRRHNGALWVLVAGVTGAATYAAAKWVGKMAMDLERPGEDLPLDSPLDVHWVLLEAQVKRITEAGRQERYDVEDAKVVYTRISRW
jgi:hypothetical protein